MDWTDAKLAELPRQNGFRQRGLQMTRLEPFADAAFAASFIAIAALTAAISPLPAP